VQRRVLVQEADFDVSDECRALASSSRCGAVAQFVGVMRDYNDGDDVLAMALEHYPGMTERSIDAIIDSAAQRWPLLSATVIHRVGELLPGSQIVFVGVGSMHRHAAFSACEFIMDFLKSEAPFWKKERRADGTERWVDARDSDTHALNRWSDHAE
jgi:molybdopterin synthase catalytic subunit